MRFLDYLAVHLVSFSTLSENLDDKEVVVDVGSRLSMLGRSQEDYTNLFPVVHM